MVDILLNNNLDFQLDNTNDMPLAFQNDLVKQAIGIAVIENFGNVIGSIDKSKVISRLERLAYRTVDESEYIDGLVDVNGRFSEEDPNTVILDVQFESGEMVPVEINT